MIRSAAARMEQLFTGLILAAALAGILAPGWFLWLKPYIPLLLGWVMFGIGLTIRTEHLKALMLRPLPAVLALGKFTVMPLIAYVIALLLQLPPQTLMGMVILGACPGGVSATVMSYLAKANTAITVVLTIITTLLSPFVTPWIIYLFFHRTVAMHMGAMMGKLFWVVLFPMVDAFIVRRFMTRRIDLVEKLFPPLSMAIVALIIAFVAAANRAVILDDPWLTVAAVILFNLSGYAVGYGVARLLNCNASTCRAVGFEYGIQDSSLGIIIAADFFSTLAALPSALCSLIQNITGPWLVQRFAAKADRPEESHGIP